MSGRASGGWLSEHRRAGVSLAVTTVVASAVLPAANTAHIWLADWGVLALLVYLLSYLVTTGLAFGTATPTSIRAWAERTDRGTVLQRYLLGTAPGPGVSIFIAAGALAVAVVWLPGYGGTSFQPAVRVIIAIGLVVVAWVCVTVSFAVAFYADNLVENEQALQMPGTANPTWADYFYFAVAVMTTFGATDVTVNSREMRRTVTTNALIAFVFNTVTVATLVAALR